MMFFWVFVSFVICQRLTELLIAKRNAQQMFSRGATEVDKSGYRYIVLMHTLFFLSLISEKLFFRKVLNEYWYVFLLLFIISLVLRYWAIISLGEYWNTRIIILQNSVRIRKGPYAYLKHPNYLAVIIELAVIPLLFSCYVTSVVFSVLNMFVITRRIKIEENALESLKYP